MLIQDGEVVSRPDNDYVTVSAYLNITVSEINDQTIALYRLPEDVPEGVLVVNIGSRTAAIYRAGVEVYDIITEFNGQAITNNTSLKEALAACKRPATRPRLRSLPHFTRRQQRLRADLHLPARRGPVITSPRRNAEAFI